MTCDPLERCLRGAQIKEPPPHSTLRLEPYTLPAPAPNFWSGGGACLALW